MRKLLFVFSILGILSLTACSDDAKLETFRLQKELRESVEEEHYAFVVKDIKEFESNLNDGYFFLSNNSFNVLLKPEDLHYFCARQTMAGYEIYTYIANGSKYTLFYTQDIYTIDQVINEILKINSNFIQINNGIYIDKNLKYFPVTNNISTKYVDLYLDLGRIEYLERKPSSHYLINDRYEWVNVPLLEKIAEIPKDREKEFLKLIIDSNWKKLQEEIKKVNEQIKNEEQQKYE